MYKEHRNISIFSLRNIFLVIQQYPPVIIQHEEGGSICWGLQFGKVNQITDNIKLRFLGKTEQKQHKVLTSHNVVSELIRFHDPLTSVF